MIIDLLSKNKNKIEKNGKQELKSRKTIKM